jgi:two-component system CheB/CheR fusion protein
LTASPRGVHVMVAVTQDEDRQNEDRQNEDRQNEERHDEDGADVAAVGADPGEDAPGLEVMLDFLHRSRGFDFTGYKRTTLARRIRRRMSVIGVMTYPEYVDYLEVRPDEFPQLFNTILINVTGFFRDPAAWTSLRTLVDERLARRAPGSQIRVWCAGCASGEEPYTLAMMFAESLGIEACAERVKIYATDVDEEALAEARLGTYSPKALENVPPELAEKYFTRSGASFLFKKELRRAVIFGRHDLVQDAPISRVDLISCRNTLMYFNAETQTRILNRLHFALNDDGILFLGKAEMLLTHANLFSPLEMKLRVFGRTKGRQRDTAPAAPKRPRDDGAAEGERARLHRAAFERAPVAQIVLDGEGRIALVNHRAGHLFALTPKDIGKPFHDLEVSYRPAELRSGIDRVRKERRPVRLPEVERIMGSGERTYLDIEIVPLLTEAGAVIGTQLSFSDVSNAHELQAVLRKTNAELETASEELQSTSEELETTNEELQSTNEELQAMNEELRQRGEELLDVSTFFGSILATLHSGIAVLDRELLVRAWNPRMEELWGIRADEVAGKPFVTLDIGLPIDQLAGTIRTSLATGKEGEQVLDCMTRRGKSLRCRVTVTPMKADPTRGVTLVVEEASP